LINLIIPLACHLRKSRFKDALGIEAASFFTPEGGLNVKKINSKPIFSAEPAFGSKKDIANSPT